MEFLLRAVRELTNNKVSFNISEDGSSGSDVTFADKTNVTTEQIDNKIKILKQEWTAQEYARNRAVAFPSIPDQLDEIYHNGIDSWKAVIKVTKDKYPKG